MRKHLILADPLVSLTTGALLLVVVWKVVLATWSLAPATAWTAFGGASPGDSGRVVVLVDADAPRSSENPVVPRNAAGLPVQVRRVSRARSTDGRDRAGNEAYVSLARSYGYTELPLYLTLDREGHVVRVAPAPPR